MKITSALSAFFFVVSCLMASAGHETSSWMALTVCLALIIIGYLDKDDRHIPRI